MEKLKLPMLSKEQLSEMLDKLYDGVIAGLPKLGSASDLASEYLNRYKKIDKAANKLIDNQVIKCTVSGFVCNLGSIELMAVSIPANLSSVLYVQMRMVAALAHMGGYDIQSDEVQTLVYATLLGTSITDVLKAAGIKIANKSTKNLLAKVPGEALIKINQVVGFRLLTKFGEAGIINLGKLLPVVGGVIGGTVDNLETRHIAKSAYKAFILNVLE